MPFIGTTPTQGFVGANPKQSFTPNGSTTVFTLTHPVASADDLEVFVGNVRQEPTAAYSAAGTTLTMTEAVASGMNFYVINKSQAQVTTTLGANTVSTSQIINANVTTAKLDSTLDLSGTGITGHGGLKSFQVFTVGSHTWTKPTGIKTVKVTVTGGGGGGGGFGTAWDLGAGGGAGGTAIKLLDVSSISSVTVSVGAGGAGGAVEGNGAGGSGSSFGSHATGNGGGGGKHGNAGASVGGTGGAGASGNINITGGQGNNGVDNGYQHSGTNYASSYGIGGGSYWGSGGRPGSYNQGAHVGQAYGSGGGGGSHSNSGPGAGGAAGVVLVEEFA